jgi:hypothetical protein
MFLSLWDSKNSYVSCCVSLGQQKQFEPIELLTLEDDIHGPFHSKREVPIPTHVRRALVSLRYVKGALFTHNYLFSEQAKEKSYRAKTEFLQTKPSEHGRGGFSLEKFWLQTVFLTYSLVADRFLKVSLQTVLRSR